VVTGEALREAAGDPAVIEQLQPLLPETGEDPVAVVSSPQFQQVCNTLIMLKVLFVTYIGPWSIWVSIAVRSTWPINGTIWVGPAGCTSSQ